MIMNVERIHPAAVRQLLDGSGAQVPEPGHLQAPSWAKRRQGRVAEAARWQRALYQRRRRDERARDDLDLARADFPTLARRHARGLEPLARRGSTRYPAHG
jgi:hypothetical protein